MRPHADRADRSGRPAGRGGPAPGRRHAGWPATPRFPPSGWTTWLLWSPAGRRLLELRLRQGRLSASGLHRVRRVARTLADLAGRDGRLTVGRRPRRPGPARRRVRQSGGGVMTGGEGRLRAGRFAAGLGRDRPATGVLRRRGGRWSAGGRANGDDGPCRGRWCRRPRRGSGRCRARVPPRWSRILAELDPGGGLAAGRDGRLRQARLPRTAHPAGRRTRPPGPERWPSGAGTGSSRARRPDRATRRLVAPTLARRHRPSSLVGPPRRSRRRGHLAGPTRTIHLPRQRSPAPRRPVLAGRLCHLTRPCVAIVGTRRATPDGQCRGIRVGPGSGRGRHLRRLGSRARHRRRRSCRRAWWPAVDWRQRRRDRR